MSNKYSFPWPSPLTASTVAVAQAARRELQCYNGVHYLLERRPKEQGRSVLLRAQDGEVQELLAETFSVRSRVHEYGGGSYLPALNAIYFIEESDQQIYALACDGSVQKLTADEHARFADLCEHPSKHILIAVRERHSDNEVSNELVTVSIDSGEVCVLVTGDDFYAAPSLSPDLTELAYISWCHPNMPWHSNNLCRQSLAENVTATGQPLLVGGTSSSKSQPRWTADGCLYYLDDQSGWWNIWCQQTAGQHCEAISPIAADLGRAQWELGSSSYVVSDKHGIYALASRHGQERLLVLDPSSNNWLDRELSQTQLGGLCASAESRVSLLAASPCSTTEVLQVATESVRTVLTASPLSMDLNYLSVAESVEFAARDGSTAQGFFYKPRNPKFEDCSELPPLIVVMHGGPTTACGNAINSLIQFWTSRGVAVFDINYRGSTGFGRDYRLALRGSWGIADVEDCVDGVKALVLAGRVDERRVVIRGGSAGGFTALASAVSSNVFAAVGCHYGIGDLELLARDTHKFESRYLDHLIGAYPEHRDRYTERSPVHHLEQINCPVFISHGRLDQVVPVNQAQQMASALRKRGLEVEELIFESERHGYTQEANIVQQLQREFEFYVRAFERSISLDV